MDLTLRLSFRLRTSNAGAIPTGSISATIQHEFPIWLTLWHTVNLSLFEADASFETVGVRTVPSLYKAEITVELAQGILKFQTRAIVVAYVVNKKNTLHGQKTTAEACAKHALRQIPW